MPRCKIHPLNFTAFRFSSLSLHLIISVLLSFKIPQFNHLLKCHPFLPLIPQNDAGLGLLLKFNFYLIIYFLIGEFCPKLLHSKRRMSIS